MSNNSQVPINNQMPVNSQSPVNEQLSKAENAFAGYHATISELKAALESANAENELLKHENRCLEHESGKFLTDKICYQESFDAYKSENKKLSNECKKLNVLMDTRLLEIVRLNSKITELEATQKLLYLQNINYEPSEEDFYEAQLEAENQKLRDKITELKEDIREDRVKPDDYLYLATVNKALEAENTTLTAALNKIGILGMSEHAYTSEFTERCKAIVQGVLK